jgi:hypothetical protein
MKRTPLEQAAIRWWRSKKPCVYTLAEHLANPTINTTTDWEKRLAQAAAKAVRGGR